VRGCRYGVDVEHVAAALMGGAPIAAYCWKYWSTACCLVESLFDLPSLDSFPDLFYDSFRLLSMVFTIRIAR